MIWTYSLNYYYDLDLLNCIIGNKIKRTKLPISQLSTSEKRVKIFKITRTHILLNDFKLYVK